jgi:hypothetical protein
MARKRKQQKNPDGSRPYCVFDCETDSFDGLPVTPFIWCAYDGIQKLTFWSTIEFVEWLKEYDGIALAHNGGKFDTVLLAEYFSVDEEIKIINGRVAEVKIGNATVRDSFLILPAPLSASGIKDEFDYKILDRNKKHLRKKFAKEIEKYCHQDCVALFEMVTAFYSRFGQRLTQAGAALATWESMGGLARRWGGAHDAHFRQFYYGGRCEAFQKGILGDGWDYFDIKSAYPWAMAQDHPASHIRDYFVHNKIDRITPQSFARIKAASRGCLPSRGKYVTEYLHHDDYREYFATGWEIIAGLETNTLKIESATIYRPNELETLKPYVDFFYAEKLTAEQSGNKIGRLIAKIFLNSLYGKYGSAADEYKKYKIVEAGIVPDGWALYAECGEFDIIQTPNAGQFYDVALAASVTGCARSKLFRQMLRVDNLAYSDTDSIICKGGNFEIGENLGQWEKVCTLNNFHVGGKKLYAGYDSAEKEWVTAHKGFSKLDTSFEDVIKAAKGEEFIINRSAPSINAIGEQKFINRKMRRT